MKSFKLSLLAITLLSVPGVVFSAEQAPKKSRAERFSPNQFSREMWR